MNIKMKFCKFIILFLIVRICIAKLTPPENRNVPNFPLRIINELNQKLDIKWNAVVTLDFKQEIENALKSLSLPVLLITKKLDTNIKTLYSDQVLTIVYLQFSSINNVYEIVEELLKHSQYTHILWIIPEANMTDLWSLADKNWFSGYTNVLYYTDGGLYSYQPVPNITVYRINYLAEYVGRKEVLDFQRYPLKVPIIKLPPRCYSFQDSSGQTITTGYLHKIVKIFAQQHNFLLMDIQGYNMSLDYEKLTQGVNNKTLDIVPLGLHIYDRFAGSSSDVLWNVRGVIVAPYPPPMFRTEYFLHPFTVATRTCILLLLLFCVFAVSFIYYRQHHTNELDFGKSALYVLAVFICQYHANFKVERFMHKLIYFLMFLNGFILTNLYLAKLSTLFVQDVYEAKIETLKDLNKTPHQCIVAQVNFNFLDKLPDIQEVVVQKLKIVSVSELLQAHRDLNQSNMFMALENKADFVLFQQRYLKVPRMYKINEAIFTKQEYFTARRDLPYIQLFNRYLKYIMESGILAKFIEDTNSDGIHSGEIRFFSESESSDVLLDFNYFKTIFLFFLFGMCVSLIVFILELLYAKYVEKISLGLGNRIGVK